MIDTKRGFFELFLQAHNCKWAVKEIALNQNLKFTFLHDKCKSLITALVFYLEDFAWRVS